MRQIPVTMVTQHPDNAGPSPFTGQRFVTASDEIDECYRAFAELGAHEYMWDWEGKFVDEAVIDRLYQTYHAFFKKRQLGRDLFLTFRIPNIWEESAHRLPRAFMNIVSADLAARQLGLHAPPIFEVILPMTTSVQQLIAVHQKYAQTSRAAEQIFENKTEVRDIDVIPLFETWEVMLNSKKILQEYLAYLKKELKKQPKYLRVFVARSDPAMNLGLLPAVIGCKTVLNNCHELMAETGVQVFPWVGCGSLPFRGGMNPDNLAAAIDEYRGTYSVTIQSAFRSDYPLERAKKAIAQLNRQLPKNWQNFQPLPTEGLAALQKMAEKVTPYFQTVVERVAPTINRVAAELPSHRERVQHVGLFGYSRGVGKVKLPRAIKFCGALYSLGIPPEFIGTGRALRDIRAAGLDGVLRQTYRHLASDLRHAGHYLNKENLELLCQSDRAWEAVREDIRLAEEWLGEKVGPHAVHHMLHRNFTSNIFYRLSLGQDIAEDLLKAAELRKSLG